MHLIPKEVCHFAHFFFSLLLVSWRPQQPRSSRRESANYVSSLPDVTNAVPGNEIDMAILNFVGKSFRLSNKHRKKSSSDLPRRASNAKWRLNFICILLFYSPSLVAYIRCLRRIDNHLEPPKIIPFLTRRRLRLRIWFSLQNPASTLDSCVNRRLQPTPTPVYIYSNSAALGTADCT